MALHDTAIVGYAETKIVEKSDRDIWELGAEILEALLDKTGFEKAEIDGLILSSSMTGAGNCFWSQTTADQLALEVDHCQTVDIGGCSPLGALARAAAAIDAGLCRTVLCLYADTQAAENNQRMRSFQGEWTAPLGYIGPPAAFGLLSRRYEHQFGLDYTSLGKLAVAQRGHAILNELAVEKLRKPISVDDYLELRMIADPIRLLDSVMVCDGASGLLVTGRKEAEKRGFRKLSYRLATASAPITVRVRRSSTRPRADTTSPANEPSRNPALSRPTSHRSIPMTISLSRSCFSWRCSVSASAARAVVSSTNSISLIPVTFRLTPAADRFLLVNADLPVAGPISSRRSGSCSVMATSGK